MNERVIFVIVMSIVTFIVSLKGYRDDDGLKPMYILIMGFIVAVWAAMLWVLTMEEEGRQ